MDGVKIILRKEDFTNQRIWRKLMEKVTLPAGAQAVELTVIGSEKAYTKSWWAKQRSNR